ncbi:L,D-transpeptidase [Paenibacillus sp. FSL R10-2734]|uniref:L,D-transpeptidase n=1 Tax=Paenibacillus sp. FSL R10-2734 TaxID=2954691 RepID=UPI0030DD910D
MKNSQHLKAYVQMHPDNKMAWYLLGKEYYKNGQQGKANYCFNQAGEVYEAFEHSKVPAEMLREYEEGLLQASRQRERGQQKLRYISLALMLLILLMVPSAVAPGISLTGEQEVLQDMSASEVKALPDPKDSVQEPAIEAGKAMYTAKEDVGVALQGKLMATMLMRKEPFQAAVLGMERDQKWLLWKEKLPLNFTLQKNGKGRMVYQSYDPKACACEPPEQGQLAKDAAEWQGDQEELATLWSAIRAYQNVKGKLPDTLGELTGSFPENWIGGTTTVMKREFSPLKAVAATKMALGTNEVTEEPTSPTNDGVRSIPTALSESGSVASDIPFFDQPLRVVVDKQNHRLAVISGSIILRNYVVGLGGDKTPEGNFVITDKVVNPNGRDNGDFGSRGLQLSDSNYAIHGTNEPDSVGKDESLGCIRMGREDVEELFALIPKGTKVVISKGVLPEKQLVPVKRFSSTAKHDQTNPHKVYHWLN